MGELLDSAAGDWFKASSSLQYAIVHMDSIAETEPAIEIEIDIQ